MRTQTGRAMSGEYINRASNQWLGHRQNVQSVAKIQIGRPISTDDTDRAFSQRTQTTPTISGKDADR